MKYLEMNTILQTNSLFSKLKALDSKRTIEIEAYSCKQTKQQKSHMDIPKPERFFLSTLELAFPDYKLDDIPLSEFHRTSYDYIKKELSYIFFTIYRNNEEVKNMLDFIDQILEQCVDLSICEFCVVESQLSEDDSTLTLFMIYDKKLKRVILIKSQLEK